MFVVISQLGLKGPDNTSLSSIVQCIVVRYGSEHVQLQSCLSQDQLSDFLCDACTYLVNLCTFHTLISPTCDDYGEWGSFLYGEWGSFRQQNLGMKLLMREVKIMVACQAMSCATSIHSDNVRVYNMNCLHLKSDSHAVSCHFTENIYQVQCTQQTIQPGLKLAIVFILRSSAVCR